MNPATAAAACLLAGVLATSRAAVAADDLLGPVNRLSDFRGGASSTEPPPAANAPVGCEEARVNIDWVLSRDRGARATFDQARRSGSPVLQALLIAQRHNPHAQGTIRRCAAWASSYAAAQAGQGDTAAHPSGTPSGCEEARRNIDWVLYEDRGARNAFEEARQRGDSVLSALLAAQAHNPHAQETIRRCAAWSGVYAAGHGRVNFTARRPGSGLDLQPSDRTSDRGGGRVRWNATPAAAPRTGAREFKVTVDTAPEPWPCKVFGKVSRVEVPPPTDGVDITVFSSWRHAFGKCYFEAGIAIGNQTASAISVDLLACEAGATTLGSPGSVTVRPGTRNSVRGGQVEAVVKPQHVTCVYRVSALASE